ncbi:GNAT family N-acetyltransferase [Candidatus Woesearchaeota archaeon]|nr:GNAT family N-acetyltransferase [Candidatus Woesearchaeota archaeon]
MKIKGKRINLRRLRRSDANFIYEHAKDKEISKYTQVPHPYTIEHAKKFINETQKKMRERTDYSFGIELKETKEIIGMMSLMKVDWANMNAEVGYWLGKSYWRKGYTYEALKMLIDFGFDDLKIHRLWARVIQPNISSAGLLRKAGFKQEGVQSKAIYRENKYWDMLMFGLVKNGR